MLAITIADSVAYRRMAELAAASVRDHTGLETRIVEPAAGVPAAVAKLLLLQDWPDQTIVYFDADTRLVADWDLRPFDQRPYFAAVPDLLSDALTADCKRFKLDPVRYVNSGVWIANQRHAAAFAWAYQFATDKSYRTSFGWEQSALNAALQRHQIPLHFLDRRYNWICRQDNPPPPDAVLLHVAGGSLHSDNRSIFERALRERADRIPA